ncbi:MAG TPA: 16S rRNA (cytosine(967)-C(5))-methyltransferase RsmB [Candidatus Limnocylindria bacterium]|nr:16S rRNA (cytosine(967)-C(5))-methyltransferase RsmB [Candidatus Limnocylindria bacterium]
MPRPLAALGARSVAHEVLVRVETSDAFADVLLGERLAASALAEDDARLCTQLVYGTLAWQGRLDHHLAALFRRPLARLDPAVLCALRLGLYQLLFLTRVPAYAAIDTSVSLVAGLGRGARGLVNALLRRAAAGPHTLALPPAAERTRRLAVEWSHPEWLVERWAAELPAGELEALLRADNEPPPTAVRVNPARGERAAIVAELAARSVVARAGRWASTAVVIERGGTRALGGQLLASGRVSFQSEASQLVVDLLAPRAGATILDACAAPGGKTTAIAERLGGRGRVLALDPRRTGLDRLGSECRRLGLSGVLAAVADARFPPARPGFDAVLVDAPCSGLGTLRRHPETRWRRRPEDIPRLAALQKAMLDRVAGLVRPGGVLVYAVCTITREETEGVLRDFLAAHPTFGVEPGGAVLAPAAADVVSGDGCVRTFPHRHGLDGFFAVRLARRDALG